MAGDVSDVSLASIEIPVYYTYPRAIGSLTENWRSVDYEGAPSISLDRPGLANLFLHASRGGEQRDW